MAYFSALGRDAPINPEPDPSRGHWKVSNGTPHPPETNHSPNLPTMLLLAGGWVVLVLVPMIFTITTGDFLAGRAMTTAILVGLLEIALAIAAGYSFQRHGTILQLAVATVFGALTLGTATTIGVLAASDYNGDPPWGAVLVANVLFNGALVFIAVSVGRGVAGLVERRHRKPA